MAAPKVTVLEKYLNTLKKMRKKYVTSELLSKKVGVYPEVINETFAYFDPMVNLDYQYNLMDLVEEADKYLSETHEENSLSRDVPKKFVTKRRLDKYDSIGDFVYKKMTIGGFIDRNVVLTDLELRALKRLITEEQAERKANKAKKK